MYTLFEISCDSLGETESFANLITSFKPSDIKPLISIRYMTLGRKDAVNVLKGVMIKSPALITHDLPSWIASHRFDRNSKHSSPSHKEAFKYLTSFATESVLEKALIVVKRNDHYTIAYRGGNIGIMCCKNNDNVPQDLFDKLNVLLELVKARNAVIGEYLLPLLPAVLVKLVLDYVTLSDCSTSNTETVI